ncbi:WhiB family transcriptional regulator [Sphaerisporangium aureirubrum]
MRMPKASNAAQTRNTSHLRWFLMSQVRRQIARPRPSWGWQDDAACRGEDLVLFFGPDGERQPERDIRERKAKAICAQCPVRAECLDYALSRPEKYGTWGGLNEDERASERRRRMRRAASAGISAA